MLLIAVSSFAVALVIASRLDMASQSSAQTFTAPPMNSAPLTGALDSQTFRNVAKAQSPMVVNIRTETTRRAQDLSDFYGGAPPDDLFRRFFGQPPGDQDQDQGQGQGQGPGQGQVRARVRARVRHHGAGSRATRRPSPPAPALSSARTGSS